jgi:signal transduction histidine kinase
MADRLAAAGGTLHVHSEPGLGTTISGTLPLAPDTSGETGISHDVRR